MKIRKIEPIKLRVNPFQKHLIDIKKLVNFKPKPEDNIFAKVNEIIDKQKNSPTFQRVYVAGAMSSDNILTMLSNIHEGIKQGGELLSLGYAPFVPHFDILFKIIGGDNVDVPIDYYYHYTLQYLKVADAVLVCKNSENSKGTINELEIAQRAGIPVFYSVKQLDNFFRGNIYV